MKVLLIEACAVYIKLRRMETDLWLLKYTENYSTTEDTSRSGV